MNTRILFAILLLPFLFFGCTDSQKNSKTSEQATEIAIKESELVKKELSSEEELVKGFQLMESNCYSCHNPKASKATMSAPPMEAVKRYYIKEETSQEEFTRELIAFVNNPTKEKAKMKKAVENFGLMAKMNFSEEKLRRIANYIYNSELEKPSWFDEHYKSEHQEGNTSGSKLSPLQMGRKIAMQTKGVLGKNLLNAINTKGTEHALSFCSTRAIHLTDSVGTALNAKVKRVSDNNRNPNNEANTEELAYIKKAKQLLTEGKELAPQLLTKKDREVAYYPILTNQMCMQCHGQPKSEVLPATLAKISVLYPKDKAVGYKPNQLRGIWVIEMNKN